jgi:hypothetical protein
MRLLGTAIAAALLISISSAAFANCASFCAKRCTTAAYKGACTDKCIHRCMTKNQ